MYLNLFILQDVSSGSRKSEQELKEEEDLQLAIALSQSEAESKEVRYFRTIFQSNLVFSHWIQEDLIF